MNALERWLQVGLRLLQDHLHERGASDREASDAVAWIGALPVPGLLAFLAGASVSLEGGEPTGREWIARAAAASEDEETPAAELEQLLGDVLSGRRPPRDAAQDPALRRKLLERLVTEALERAGVPATPEEIRQVAALLESGEFFRDFGASAAAVASVIPELPGAIASDLLRSPRHLLEIAAALAADLGESPTEVGAVLSDLRAGHPVTRPELLTRTLRRLYATATLAAIVGTLRVWLDPDHEAVRLAILLYARAHGLPLEPKDLDALLIALDTENPDLGPLLIAAWDHLEARLGRPGLSGVLASLGGEENPTSPPPLSERQRH
ncbi:MAG: hypothetical protein ACR2PQ_08235 [Myxococcota bacterium]